MRRGKEEQGAGRGVGGMFRWMWNATFVNATDPPIVEPRRGTARSRDCYDARTGIIERYGKEVLRNRI